MNDAGLKSVSGQDWVVYQGDCLSVLKKMEAGSAHLCVTSPPYFNLRSYLDCPNCGDPDPRSPTCKKCGHYNPDKEREIGSESSPEGFVESMVKVGRALRRVLRDDGTWWLNIGDKSSDEETEGLVGIPWQVVFALRDDGWVFKSDNLWVKRSPMPASFKGWRWERCRVKTESSKRNGQAKSRAPGQSSHSNAMKAHNPEEAAKWVPCPGCSKCRGNDGFVLRRGRWRPTVAHEYIFMLAKTTDYYADGYAVSQEIARSTTIRDRYTRVLDDDEEQFAVQHDHETVSDPDVGANLRSCWVFPGDDRGPLRLRSDLTPAERDAAVKELKRYCEPAASGELPTTMVFRAKQLSESHYAAYPVDLPALAIRCGTSSKGCCPECGAPWVRVIEQQEEKTYPEELEPHQEFKKIRGGGDTGKHTCIPEVDTIGWNPSCDCGDDLKPVPATVIDPFNGAGTTGLASLYLGRKYVGIELSDKFVEITRKRLTHRGRLKKVSKTQKKIDAEPGLF